MKIDDWFTLATEIEDLNCQVVYIVNNFIDRNIKAQVINNRSNISIMLIEDKLFDDFANKIAPINTFMMDKKKYEIQFFLNNSDIYSLFCNTEHAFCTKQCCDH